MKTRSRNWQLIFKGSIENFTGDDSLIFWQSQPSDEKFKEVGRLIDQALRMQGKGSFYELRLLRSTAVIKRQ